MTYLVTGGAGFIGSNLIRKLSNKGYKIDVIDNLSTGNIENVPSFNNNIRLIIPQNEDDFSSVFLDDYDAIFHLGNVSTSKLHEEDPANGLYTNTYLHLKLLNEIKNKDIPLVYASTSSMYGGVNGINNESKPIDINKINSYSYTMLGKEIYGRQLKDECRNIGLRFFSVYGKREEYKQNFANLVTQFLWKMMEGEKPIIWGDGTQTRDFTYVDDICEGCLKALNNGQSGEVYNLATGEDTSLNDLVDLLNHKLIQKGILKEEIEPTYKDIEVDNYVQEQNSDTYKASNGIGFNAKTDLSKGIDEIIEYYIDKGFLRI